MFTFVDAHPPVLVIFVMMVGFLMPTIARYRRSLCGPVACLALVFALINSVHYALITNAGQTISYAVGNWDAPWGIEILINPFAAYMLSVISFICLIILTYSLSSLAFEIPEKGIGWYYTVFLLLTGAMMGMAMTNDIFNMYVFIEVTGIAACALVLAKGGRESTEAAFKYLILATIGSGFVVTGIALMYIITGNLNIVFVAKELAAIYTQYPFVVWTIITFFLVGFSIKSALFPLHIWLPDAHTSAPSTSSAILSGLVVKTYVVAFLKFFFLVFGFQLLDELFIRHVVLVMATAAILMGSIFAFVQLNLKRRLAYSSVAQIGYIFLGIGLGSKIGLAAGILHILNHAIMKACLFLAAGAIYRQTGEKQVNRLQGIGYQMPITMFAISIAALSMVGLPLFNGFISKWYLAQGSIDAGMPVFVGLLVLSGLLNASYFLPVIWQAFFVVDQHDPKSFSLDKIPYSMSVPLIVLSVAIVYLGIDSSFPWQLITKAVNTFLP